jgi:hypothetical protein
MNDKNISFFIIVVFDFIEIDFLLSQEGADQNSIIKGGGEIYKGS